MNKLVPCVWLLSGALEVWSLPLRLQYDMKKLNERARNEQMAKCQNLEDILPHNDSYELS